MNPLTFTRIALLASGFAIAAVPAFAGDTLTVARSYKLPAAPGKTWAAIKDFGGVHTWIPAVEKTDISKGGHNKVGTVRVLGLKGGGGVTEKLTAYSGAGHSMSYKMLESPLPVVGYRSTLAVKPGKSGGSIVNWSANFKAKEGTPDAEAKKVIEGIYDSSVDNLKKQLGG